MIAPGDTVLYYLCLLSRGPNWTPEITTEVERIQEARRAYIRAIAASGELILAGPVADDGPMVGVMLLKTATIEEARSLAEQDPSVRIGRLKVEVHPWRIPTGVLP